MDALGDYCDLHIQNIYQLALWSVDVESPALFKLIKPAGGFDMS